MNKRLLLSIHFICAFCSVFLIKSLYAQSVPVPNGGFESWSPEAMFEVPDVCPPTNYFDNSNYRSYADANMLNMTKVAHGGGSAMRLETITYTKGTQLDTAVGYAVWGTPPQGNGPLFFAGGFPFTDKNVSGISVDLRYSINVASSGIIFVQFKKNGVPIDGGNAPLSQPGLFAFPVFGTQATFTTQTFSIPGLSIVPDTCVVAFVSGNPSGGGHPGDYMEIDNIAFTGTSLVVPGGNLDSWVMLPPVEAVDIWNFQDDPNNANTFRTTDKNSGNYAIQLRTIDWGGGGNNMQTQRAILGKNISGQNFNVNIPGMAVTGRPQSFGFYYKYSTLSTDSASAFVRLTKWNGTSRDDVGMVYIYLLSSGAYVYKNALINYQNGTVPDSAFIEFDASKNWPGKNGSLLKVDDVIFNYCNEVLAVTGSNSVCANATGVPYSVVDSPGATYSWTLPSGASIASGTGTNKITVDFGGTGGTVSVIKTYIDGCTPTNANLVVGIQASASANANSDQSICASASATLNGLVTGAGGGTWTGGGGTFLPDANTLNATYTPSVGEETAGSVTLTLTTTGNGSCSIGSDNMLITIKSVPAITSAATGTICSGVAQNYDITANITAAFSWNRSAVTGISNSAATNQTADPITETLTNTTSSAKVVRYVITPTAAGCAGAPFNYDVTVNPTPAVYSAATGSICSGIAQNYDITSNVSGATFSWDRAAVSGVSNTGVTAQTTNPITETLVNTGTSSVNVVYLITPTMAGCSGAAFNYSVTVANVPTANAGGDQTVCAGSPNVVLAGIVTSATSQSWSGGAGTFNPDNSTLNATYTPSAGEISAGSVTLTVSGIKAGCTTVTDQMVITINVCTGITKAFVREFNIYPSPANSVINVEAIGVTLIKDITVLNALQQSEEVKIMEISGGMAKLDVTNLSPGIYFIRISDGNAITVQKITIE